MFSIITMASSTTKPTEIGQRHQRQVVEREADRPHRREGAGERQRHGHPGGERRRQPAQEHEHHHHHQRDGDEQRPLHVVDAGADRRRAVGEHGESMPAGTQRFSSGSSARIWFDRLDDVRVGLLGDRMSTAGLPLNQADERVLRTPSSMLATADRRMAVPCGCAPRGGRNSAPCEAARWCRSTVLHGPVDGADRAQRVGVGDGGADVLQAQRPSRQGGRDRRGRGRRLLGAADATSATPGTCEMRCAIDGIGGVVDRARLQRVEVSARIRIGARPGWPCGTRQVGRSPGRSTIAAFNAACTSRAALSILRSGSNCM